MIKRYENGPFMQNTWVYINESSNEAVIVDPGEDIETVFEMLANAKVTHIFVTHGHLDHIFGLEEAKNKYPDALIVAHEKSMNILPDPVKNLSQSLGMGFSAPKPDWTYSGDTASIEAAGQEWTLIFTPGHAPDHTVFFGQDMTLFGGDVLFEQGGVGRVDLPGSSQLDMRISIAKVLSAPSETIVYPGHGSSFSIEEVRPFFENMVSL